MKNLLCVSSIALGFGLAGGIGPRASADISQATISSPGGFIQAGAYNESPSPSGAHIPGADLAVNYPTWRDFHEQAFADAGTALASASYSNGTVVNSASGSAGLGFVRAAASDGFPCNTTFSAGMINGGWKETFTVSHPALNGQAGFLVFQIRARGTLASTGFNGAASLNTTGYKNNVELLVNPLFNRGNSDVASSFQRAQWSVSSAPDVTRTVDGTITMAVPITFGQSFTLGIYAWAIASQRSQAFAACYSTSSADFSGSGGGGVTWAGITSVQSGGVPVSGYTITSGSGINWSQPYAPCQSCPADFNCDGAVDFFDYDEFVVCFENSGCTAADFNHDTSVDFFDYDDFVVAFEAGC